MKGLRNNTIMREVAEVLSSFNLGDEHYATGVMLLAALHVGPDEAKIAEVTGLPREYLDPRAERLRENGVWKDGKTCCGWFAEETGGVEFVMDVCVAEGLMARAKPKRKPRSKKIGAAP